MKTIHQKNWKTIFFAILILSLNACKEYEDLVPEITGTPAGGVLLTKSESVLGNELVFTVDMFAVNHYGNFIEKLTDEHISIEDPISINIQNNSIEYQKNPEIIPYSAGLLFDQSGSIASTDPYDARIVGGKAFVDVMSDDDESSISVFAGNSFFYPFNFNIMTDFTDDKEQLKSIIEDFTGKAGGGTPLYNSIEAELDYVEANANHSNKAVIVFSDGEDTYGGNVSQLIEKANDLNIKIYSVGLGNGVDNSILADISLETGGSLMWAEDAPQLIALYSSLGELLNGSAAYYRTQWTAKKLSGDWISGDELFTNVKVSLPDGTLITLPVKVKVQ